MKDSEPFCRGANSSATGISLISRRLRAMEGEGATHDEYENHNSKEKNCMIDRLRDDNV